MNINHNRIRVSDLETNQPNKTLVTNEHGELEFSTIAGDQNLEQTLTNRSEAIEKYIKIKNSDASQAVTLSKHHLDVNKIDPISGYDFHVEYGCDKVRIRQDEDDRMELYWNASTGNFYFPTGMAYKSNNIIITDTTVKTVNGESIVGNGNIDLSNKQDVSSQIEIGTSQVISNSWHGKTVLFTANCTLTVPTSLIASFIFNGITLPGVTINWVITAPHTWLFGIPASTGEKQIFTFTKRGSTNSILLLTTNITSGNLDVDAQNFIIASQNYDYQNVINDLVVSLKSNNLWNKMQAIYPFIGTTQVNHRFNLKNPLDTNAAFRLTFNGGGTHSINGYQTNGSNAYANTFLNVNSFHTFSNAGLTMVCGTNNIPVTTNSFDLGAQKSSSPWECYQINLNHGVSKNNNVFVVGTIGISKTAVNNAKGIHTISKTTNTEATYSKNGTVDLIITGTQTGIVPSLPYFIGCLNNGGSPYGYSNQRIQFTAIHEGMNNTEVQLLHSIINSFESDLGRKTW